MPDQPDDPELLLKPSGHQAFGPYRAALVEDGISLIQLAVDDVHVEHERLGEHGVRFAQEPLALGDVVTAVFDGTCGNLVKLASAS